MKKHEAIELMKQGVKITHTNFTPDEWMTMNGSIIMLENGVECHKNEFWKWRNNVNWNDGYSIYNDNI